MYLICDMTWIFSLFFLTMTGLCTSFFLIEKYTHAFHFITMLPVYVCGSVLGNVACIKHVRAFESRKRESVFWTGEVIKGSLTACVQSALPPLPCGHTHSAISVSYSVTWKLQRARQKVNRKQVSCLFITRQMSSFRRNECSNHSTRKAVTQRPRCFSFITVIIFQYLNKI